MARLMKGIFCILFILCFHTLFAQSDTILIHFLYGSRPAKGYRDTEKKYFGGIKGGHVNIEAKGHVLDFMKGNCPLFPNKKKPSGGFRLRNSVYWDTAGSKWATIVVPVSPAQMKMIDSLFHTYSQSTPYDYAIFGMRCAAASYDVLSKAGLFKELPEKKDIGKYFYPKLLRKKLFKWAEKNGYTILKHAGRGSRKWENDKGLF